jgi:hypothetical protein
MTDCFCKNYYHSIFVSGRRRTIMFKKTLILTSLLVLGLTISVTNGQSQVKINFQSRTQGSGEVPLGYLPDYGDVYGDRGNGFSYGWSANKAGSSRDRDSDNAPDQRYDTNNQLDHWSTGVAYWEIELPNAIYDVYIVGGDPSYLDQTNSYFVEGIEVIDEIPSNTPGNFFDEFTVTVAVEDGRLTIAEVPSANPKICFVHITDVRVALPISPADNSILLETSVQLEWLAGKDAIQHDVYFGENFYQMGEATTSTEGIYKGRQSEIIYPASSSMPVEPGKTYYWRIDEFDGTNIWKGGVASFTVQFITAFNPGPVDGAIFVDPNTEFNWDPGATAENHLLYFGEDYDSVANANTESPEFMDTLGITNWNPPDSLSLNKIYYWRVDEQESDGTINQGAVWSFTTTTRTGGGLKGEYFNNQDLAGDPVLVRIDPQIDFDWGLDTPDPNITNVDSFSIRWTGELEIPASGEWTLWVNADDIIMLWVNGQLLINESPGIVAWYGATITLEAGFYPIVMEFHDTGNIALARLLWQGPLVPARQIIPQGAYEVPLKAIVVSPSNGATGVHQTPTLVWSPGENAAEHDVYFGTDHNDVANADTTTPGIYRGRQVLDETSYTPPEAPFEWNKTLYWRIDEVNDTEMWQGHVSSFTTADYLIIDDFEDYNDYPPDEIWNTWIDGYGVPTNGSTAGYPAPDFVGGEHYMESNIVFTGFWSMPLFYDNSVGISEVTRAFDSSMGDWTAEDVTVLTLFCYGDAGNALEPMFVALNGNAVITNDDPRAVLYNDWTQWDIQLQNFADQGVNLNNISSMSIGFGNKANPVAGGEGHVFFDDIRLYRTQRNEIEPLPESADPGTDNLVAYYAFTNNVQDSSGNSFNGTVIQSPGYTSGPTGYETAIKLNGVSQYVELPIGPVINTLTDCTIATWVNWSGEGDPWQRIFDFGNDNIVYMFLTGNSGDNTLRFGITTAGNSAGAQDQTNADDIIPSGWNHVAVTIDSDNTTHTLYLNGKVVGQNTEAGQTPSVLGQTTQNWLGRSQWEADPYFDGSLDEFYIFDRVLSQPEILYLVGR